jgi:hypothetical protein
MWMFEQPLGHEATAPLRLTQVSSLGCELLLVAALEAVVDTPAERQLTSQAAVRQSLLCRLAFPVTLALAGTSELDPAFEPTAEQDFAIDALQPSLARWWRAAERLKARLLMPADLLRAGLAQARVLDGLLTWAHRTDRRERCTFLLEAMAPLVQGKASAADFVAAFDERISLRERHAARKAAAAALHGVARLRQWDEEARTVRFIDDGYDAAQARVRAYEMLFGAQRFIAAQRLCDELDALPT